MFQQRKFLLNEIMKCHLERAEWPTYSGERVAVPPDQTGTQPQQQAIDQNALGEDGPHHKSFQYLHVKAHNPQLYVCQEQDFK